MGILDSVRDTRPAAGAAPPVHLADWERLAYLREVCELLWPSPAEITLQSETSRWPYISGTRRSRARDPAQPAGRDFVLVPGVRHPRLLVPAAPRAAAAAALRQYGQPRSWSARLGVTALALGLASGLGGTVFGVRVRMNAPPDGDNI